MVEAVDQCGIFGKLPQQGDFISQFLPSELTEYWHSWLQSCLSVSREQLEHDWLDTYLTSPVWRFAISGQVLWQKPMVGVMIPSVDEIGRYFPLTVAHAGDAEPWAAYLHGESWFDQAQDLALSALDESTSYEQFIGALEALEPPSVPSMAQFQLPEYASQTRAFVFTSDGDKPANEFALNLLTHAYQYLQGQFALWWTEGSEKVPPCLLITRGLPEAGQFAAMLDGQWASWGWSEESVINTPEAS